jgi:hypothetical protein
MIELGCLGWLSTLLACAAQEVPPPTTPEVRMDADGFSILLPQGGRWRVEKTRSSLTFERRESTWIAPSRVLILCVSRHLVPPGALSERSVAVQFLEAEKAILCEYEPYTILQDVVRQMATLHGKRLHRLSFRAESRRPSEDPVWANHLWLEKAEIDVYFPHGPGSWYFFCFESREIHQVGWVAEPEGGRLLEEMIDSLQVEEPSISPRSFDG